MLKASKSFFSKAKGKEYIKEKLLKGLGSLESRVAISFASNKILGWFKNYSLGGIGEEQRSSYQKSLSWVELNLTLFTNRFDLSLDEDEPLSDTDIQLNPNYNTHLSKPDSEYYLKKSLSANSVSKELNQKEDYHFDFHTHTQDIEQMKKNEGQMIRGLCTASFVHKEKEEGKLTLSKGDDFYCLPEEEN